jgi:two-component system sensor histidine kinase/response regulator
MDGYEVVRRIRAEAARGGVPVIAMTAHAMAEERERCMAAGMNDHITKPIDPDAMFSTLQRWLPRRASAGRVAAAAPATAQADAPLTIPGIDVAGGLRRVAGNHGLYRRLLEKYVEGQAGAAQALRAALAAGDRATAERIAHTVKGVSGNIGADAPAQAAAALEQAIRDGGGDDAQIAAFDAAVAATVAAIRGAIGGAVAVESAAATTVDAAAAQAAITRLAALLAAADGEAGDCYSEHEALLRGALGADAAAIGRAINDFDFDAALAKLRAAAAARQFTAGEG